MLIDPFGGPRFFMWRVNRHSRSFSSHRPQRGRAPSHFALLAEHACVRSVIDIVHCRHQNEAQRRMESSLIRQGDSKAPNRPTSQAVVARKRALLPRPPLSPFSASSEEIGIDELAVGEVWGRVAGYSRRLCGDSMAERTRMVIKDAKRGPGPPASEKCSTTD